MDISLHYVLAHRHDQPAAAGDTPVSSRRPFTITNDPVKSPVLETMLKRVCAGMIVLGGVPNQPIYGMHFDAQAIFFRKPDGTPWVKFYERGYQSLAPVTQVGKMVTWTGRQEYINVGKEMASQWLQYTVWPDGDNHLSGAVGSRMFNNIGVAYNSNSAGNTVELTCTTEVLPTVTWNDWFAQSKVTSPVDLSSSDAGSASLRQRNRVRRNHPRESRAPSVPLLLPHKGSDCSPSDIAGPCVDRPGPTAASRSKRFTPIRSRCPQKRR